MYLLARQVIVRFGSPVSVVVSPVTRVTSVELVGGVGDLYRWLAL